jgi:hypothetical protein
VTIYLDEGNLMIAADEAGILSSFRVPQRSMPSSAEQVNASKVDLLISTTRHQSASGTLADDWIFCTDTLRGRWSDASELQDATKSPA